ncbi:hypothetical protein SAMN04487775_106107 [Treponema bryantii]|uniref:Uncharacterized protein n=1 Tax=Treponema bryantii TaxID=163 RepID=A0A1I3L8M1_9SPIR|nr:hypothetical protein [Treponema bryantii]SFI80960.1 hypothetical protein SAMN04487775_106107 [Treponema bryantii]
MKKLFTLFTAGLALLCLSFTGCSNSADGGDGGDGKNISASQVDNGIEVTVQAPEGCSVIYFIRSTPGSTHEDYWYLTEKATTGANTAIDYFTEANKTYIYYAQFYDANWKKMDKSDSVEINSSVKGLDSPVVTNVPKATYNSGTRKFTFTTKPTFSYTQSKVGGYPNLVIDLLFKTADETYDTICTYRLGDDSTGEVQDWVFNKHPGKTMEFVNFKFKLKSADYKTSYEWDVGRGADIPAITLSASDEYTYIENTTPDDFINGAMSVDPELAPGDNVFGLLFKSAKESDGSIKSAYYLVQGESGGMSFQENNPPEAIVYPVQDGDDTCRITLDEKWRDQPIYFFVYKSLIHAYVENWEAVKTSGALGLAGTYLNGDRNGEFIEVVLNSNGTCTCSWHFVNDSSVDEGTYNGTYIYSNGMIKAELDGNGPETMYLVYKSEGKIAFGEYFIFGSWDPSSLQNN